MAATVTQKLGTFLYIVLFTGGFWSWILYISLFYYGGIITRTLLALYTVYIWTPGLGRWGPTHGLKSAPFRAFPWWNKAAEYYPMSLVKTAELDPSKGYVFGFHPHGIISMSAFVAFATEGLQVSKTFPGLTFHVLTLVQNFYTPFVRDVLLRHGMADCAKQTCINILREGHGHAIVLCVGGAREALLAEQDQFHIVLGRRLGFVRIAVQTGSALVPVLSFGENNIFQVSKPKERSTMAQVQKFLLKVVGLGFPLFHGTGLLFSPVGVLPYQSPIRIVVGKPIEAPHIQDVYSEEGKRAVSEVHAQYVKALRGLWDQYKDQYALARKGTFKIVDLPPPKAAPTSTGGTM